MILSTNQTIPTPEPTTPTTTSLPRSKCKTEVYLTLLPFHRPTTTPPSLEMQDGSIPELRILACANDLTINEDRDSNGRRQRQW
jgi:hypothetical protein